MIKFSKFTKAITLFCFAAFLAACTKAPLKMVFSSADDVSVFNWKLDDFSPSLPDDWTDYNYLVLEMRTSSPQRFLTGPITSDGPVAKSIQPFPGAWLRFCIPLEFYRELPPSAVDMAATYNKARPLGQINIHNPGIHPVTKVEGLTFFMKNPINNPTLEIRSAWLSVEAVRDTVLQEGYLVDRFGQWATQDWQGKIKSEAQLRQEWDSELNALSSLDTEKFSQYGGYKNHRVEATGFFRVEKINDRWWFVDPEGYLFLSNGSNCINASSNTRTIGREYIFEGLRITPPPTDGRPQRAGGADYYNWNIRDRYGDDFRSQWVNTAVMRMNDWGLNTIANWSSGEIIQSNRVPFTLQLRGLQLDRGIMGLPDIYQPDYESAIEEAIRSLTEQYKDNKWLLGYFVGNEQPWPDQEVILCNRVLAGDSYMKTALVAYLEAHGNTDEAKTNFVLETFDKFLEMVNKYLKKHAPNHLNLGMRFGDCTDRIIEITGKHFDVFSINSYSITPSKEYMNRIANMTGLPIIIGEYHFGTPDRGMSAGIVQVSNHQERANAFRYYNEQAFSHPSLIGTHWFQWIDQPNTGRMDGENYNIGLLDITDRPYPEMVEAMKMTFGRLYDVHSGKIEPYGIRPEYQSY